MLKFLSFMSLCLTSFTGFESSSFALRHYGYFKDRAYTKINKTRLVINTTQLPTQNKDRELKLTS